MHGADFERQILSAHLSVRVPTTSRSAHAPLDFLNPALRSAPLKSVFGQLRSVFPLSSRSAHSSVLGAVYILGYLGLVGSFGIF